MKSKTSLLVSIPALVGLVVAGMTHRPNSAHAAPTPPTSLFTVAAAAGYYQIQTNDFNAAVTNLNPAENFVVAVKDRANNPITNATVTFTAPATSGVTFVSPVAQYNNGFYVLPLTVGGNPNVVVSPTAPSGPVTLTATATVPTAIGARTIGTATFTIQVGVISVDSNSTDAASIRYVYSPSTNPSAPTPPSGGVGTTSPIPPVQSAPVNTVYPFQDEVLVLNSSNEPVSGAPVTFTIANTGTPANLTPNAQFINGGSGQTYMANTDAEGIATAPPIQALQLGTFVVTASTPVTADLTPTGNNTISTSTLVGLTFNYLVTVQAAEACSLAINAFIPGDSFSLRTGDGGPLASLTENAIANGFIGPATPGNGIGGFGSSTGSAGNAQRYPLISYLSLGAAGGPGKVTAIPLVPRYLNTPGAITDLATPPTPATPNTSTLYCTISTPTGGAITAANPVTVTVTVSALVVASSRAGIARGNRLTVTITKTGYGLTTRGLTHVIAETISVQNTSGATPTSAFGTGISVAPQNFIIALDSQYY